MARKLVPPPRFFFLTRVGVVLSRPGMDSAFSAKTRLWHQNLFSMLEEKKYLSLNSLNDLRSAPQASLEWESLVTTHRMLSFWGTFFFGLAAVQSLGMQRGVELFVEVRLSSCRVPGTFLGPGDTVVYTT